MSRRRRAGGAAALAVMLLGGGAGCGSGGSGGGGGGVGAAAARGIAASMTAAEPVKTPWRCALPPAAALATAGAAPSAPVGWTLDGDRLVAAQARPKLTIAAVAQARGAAVDVRAALRAAHVDLVLAVGGMGGNTAESQAALGALVDPAWLVVAVPGDAEDWPAHARAVRELAAGGGAIVDGAAVRIIDTGAAVVATVPGERWPERLGAGAEGCVHDPADIARVVAAMTAVAADRPRVLVSGPAPQGHASDLAPGGLHAGEVGLAALVAEAGIDLVVHAPVGAVAAAAPGTAKRGGAPVVLAAGSLDPLVQRDPDGRAIPGAPLIATIDARTLSWR